MLLFLAFALGVLLIVFGVLFIFFPRTLEELSNTFSQVIINIETQISRTRIPVGLALFGLGAWIIWSVLNAKRYV